MGATADAAKRELADVPRGRVAVVRAGIDFDHVAGLRRRGGGARKLEGVWAGARRPDPQ